MNKLILAAAMIISVSAMAQGVLHSDFPPIDQSTCDTSELPHYYEGYQYVKEVKKDTTFLSYAIQSKVMKDKSHCEWELSIERGTTIREAIVDPVTKKTMIPKQIVITEATCKPVRFCDHDIME